MIRLKQEIASHIVTQCTARTDAALRDRFGISYNTFRKIEQGQPIRVSLALRLQDRLKREIAS